MAIDLLRKLFRTQTQEPVSEVKQPQWTPPAIRPEEFPYSVAWITDQGTARAENEDALFCMQSMLATGSEMIPFGLFVIADGLGGHADGQLASAITARIVAAELIRSVHVSLLEERAQDSDSMPISESFFQAIDTANHFIRLRTKGGGSTVIAVVVLANTAYVAHVGDSRAYIIDGSSVTQITHDHSPIGRLMDMNQLSESEAMSHPQRHYLYKALGQGSAPEPDFFTQALSPGSRLVLCTDGLWTVVPREDLANLVRAAATPQLACNELLKMAIARGSDDNVSMILLSSRP
jgi:PPM family protein phosphatase